MRIIFMGTGLFALPALKILHASSTHEIVGVYTKEPKPAGRGHILQKSVIHLYADAHNLCIFTPKTLKTEEAQKEYAALHADIAIVASYGLILPKEILGIPLFGCINIHPSLLPRWRGAAPIQHTLMKMDKETAICIMQMDEGLDTGPIWLQEKRLIPVNISAGQFEEILAADAAILLLEALDIILKQEEKPVPQKEEGMTYAAKITKETARIDWNNTAESIVAQIQGCNPLPGAWFMHNGGIIKIFEAIALEDDKTVPVQSPGTVINTSFDIVTKKGVIRPLLIQKQGSVKMESKAFLRGYKIEVNSCVN